MCAISSYSSFTVTVLSLVQSFSFSTHWVLPTTSSGGPVSLMLLLRFWLFILFQYKQTGLHIGTYSSLDQGETCLFHLKGFLWSNSILLLPGFPLLLSQRPIRCLTPCPSMAAHFSDPVYGKCHI